jgi:heterodisulfide reductase subunit B2
MVEVLIEDIGFEEMARPVIKPLEGLKIAGYVGCQTNRPFGIAGESFEDPKYLDKMVETVGAEPVPYDQKITCCGGALAFSEPDKSQKQIRDIVESAYDHGADMIVTPASCARPTSRSTRARSTRSRARSSTCRWCTTLNCCRLPMAAP